MTNEPTTNRPGFMDSTALPTFSGNPQCSCPTGLSFANLLNAPKAGPGHAGRDHPYDGVRRLDDPRETCLSRDRPWQRCMPARGRTRWTTPRGEPVHTHIVEPGPNVLRRPEPGGAP